MATGFRGNESRCIARRRPRFARGVALLGLLLPIASLLSCIGVPIKHRELRHVVATGWDRDGKPMALAQQASLTKWALAASPDGPGISEHFRRGSFLLLRDGRTVPLELAVPGAVELSVDKSRASGDGFLLLFRADVPTEADPLAHSHHCALIGADGSVSKCRTPEGADIPWWAVFVLPGGREVWWIDSEPDEETRALAFSLDTGELTRVTDDFLRLRTARAHPEDPGSIPCEPDHAQLSPQRDLWAIRCGFARGEEWWSGLWVLDRSGEMRLVHQLRSAPDDAVRRVRARERFERTLEDMVTEPEEESGLAWSPDQSRLYWCPGRYLAGAVISVQNRSFIPHEPCFVLPSWSPDGKRIVGVAQSKLEVWELPPGN